MLKTMGMHKLVAPAIALMLGIGVVLQWKEIQNI